jgi:hypothetical protein
MSTLIDKPVNKFLNQTVAISPKGYDLTLDQSLVLGYIWSKVQQKKETAPEAEYYSVPIDKKEWKAAFGDEYNSKYKPMIDMGFIDCTGYLEGEFCRSFWLTRKFWETPHEKKMLPLKQRINNPITAAKKLSKFSNKTKDEIEALDPFTAGSLRQAMDSLSFDDGIITTLKKMDGITVENLKKAKSSLRNFHLKEFWYSRSKGGRLYSSITLMPKVFRRHLLMDGRPLIEIDIKAAQLTIIASLYDQWVIPYSDSEEEARSEKERYNEVLINKDIYTDIFNNLCNGDREKIKTTISTWLNGGILYISICDILGKHFPHLANFLSGETSYSDQGTHNPMMQTPIDKRVGRQIMEIESKIMIENIFNDYHDKFKMITIHDAILVTEEHVDTIVKEIKKQFKDTIGIIPQVTVGKSD